MRSSTWTSMAEVSGPQEVRLRPMIAVDAQRTGDCV